jgi:outer membrane autotransporter protein
MVEASGKGSRIDLTAGQTIINMLIPTTNTGGRSRGAFAELGGEVTLTNATVELGLGTFSRSRALDASDPGSTLIATNPNSIGVTDAFSVGAYSTLIHPSGFYVDLVGKFTEL